MLVIEESVLFQKIDQLPFIYKFFLLKNVDIITASVTILHKSKYVFSCFVILLTKSVYQNIITETIFKHRHNKIVINKKKLLNEHILKGIIDRRNLPYRYLLCKNLIHITTEKALKYNKKQGQKPLGTHLKIINCTHNDFCVTVTLYTIVLYPSCVCFTILRVSNIGKTQFPSQS